MVFDTFKSMRLLYAYGIFIALKHPNDYQLIKNELRRNLPSSLINYGAGGRTRTGTVSPPVDFESTTSANSITPANILQRI